MRALATPLLFVVLAFLLAPAGLAQAPLDLPVASPYAKVSEQIGITSVTVTYGRPAVNDREVWGALVPYGYANPFPNFGSGNPVPWRAGANENTVVTFEHDVFVEGQPLAAGRYGLHMVPQEDAPWTVIFSENAGSWGSFFYDESEDALRVEVTPEEAPYTERLRYEFSDYAGDAATLALRWENLRVPIRLRVQDQDALVMAGLRDALRSRAGFAPQGWAGAARYALTNGHLEEAEAWAQQALGRLPVMSNYNLLASVYEAQGDAEQAEATRQRGIDGASENELNTYGYQLMAQGQMERAGEIFLLNVERNPDAWNPHDSLGEWYMNQGDRENARKYYEMALDKLPEGQDAQRDRIEGVLAQLEG